LFRIVVAPSEDLVDCHIMQLTLICPALMHKKTNSNADSQALPSRRGELSPNFALGKSLLRTPPLIGRAHPRVSHIDKLRLTGEFQKTRNGQGQLLSSRCETWRLLHLMNKKKQNSTTFVQVSVKLDSPVLDRLNWLS